jgi:FeS assembly SUF system regulator
MIRLSRLTDYAVVITAELARTQGETQAAAVLSNRTGIPEPTVAKVLKVLARAELVSSSRGVNGGYALNRSPEDVSVASLIEAVNGPIVLTACVDGVEDDCNIAAQCQLRGRWTPVNEAIRAAFTSLSLADLIAPETEPRAACGGCALHHQEQVA